MTGITMFNGQSRKVIWTKYSEQLVHKKYGREKSNVISYLKFLTFYRRELIEIC